VLAGLCALVVAAVAVVAASCNQPPARGDAMPPYLEQLLKAESPQQFNDFLDKHGPIRAEEIGTLAERAREKHARVRLNAARLLVLAQGDARDPALRKLAEETEDPEVFALAAGKLPDGKQVAGGKPHLIRKALRSDDKDVVAAAVRLAWLSGMPEATSELKAKLEHRDRKVRTAVLEILAEAGPGPFQAELRAMLVDPGRRADNDLGSLYAALLHSDDPSTGGAFARSLENASPGDQVALTNAIHGDREHKPWVDAFLVDQLKREQPWRWSALRLLGERPAPPRAEIVPVCRAYLAKKVATGEPDKALSLDSGVSACAAFLGKLAGRSFRDVHEMLDFANRWKP
jgi:hypothetical protein